MSLGKAKAELRTISPARWRGEKTCRVGPFSSREVALYFATYVVNVGDYGVTSGRIFAKRDEWFVETLGYPRSKVVRGEQLALEAGSS